MRQLFGKIILGLVTVVAVSAGFGTTASAQDVNKFTIEDFQIQYYLGRDKDNRSTLKTEEYILAEFPETDQNHGLERAIPTSYDGHTTDLKLISVTDQNGANLKYSTNTVNGNLVLRIGDMDTYVHGQKKYKITYTQRDVTKYFENTKRDEFYWDTNGTEWAVPIMQFSATVHLDKALQEKLQAVKCYIGKTGSTHTCELKKSADGFVATSDYLYPYENITVSFGFPAGTFAAHVPTFQERLISYFALMLFATIPLAIVAFIVLITRYNRQSERRERHATIIPEYLPPRGISVPVAASIYGSPAAVFSAQMIDFAVRHYTRIYQTREKSFFKPARYEIEIIRDISDLLDEEQEIFRDLFPDTAVGTRLDLKDLQKHSATLYAKVSDNKGKIDKSIRGAYGLRQRVDSQTRWFKRAALVLLIAAILTLSPWLAAAALTALILAYSLYPLTDKGVALYKYLEGLKMYIKTAEVDRLKMLQSPEGAQKIGSRIDTNDTRVLIKLYERVLPYAILFGMEKDWNKQLGSYYESIQKQPDWYSGNSTTFNAAVFAGAMSSFNTSANYSSAASSSSGGSSGGGSSGGGGGGGGGGGF